MTVTISDETMVVENLERVEETEALGKVTCPKITWLKVGLSPRSTGSKTSVLCSETPWGVSACPEE